MLLLSKTTNPKLCLGGGGFITLTPCVPRYALHLFGLSSSFPFSWTAGADRRLPGY